MKKNITLVIIILFISSFVLGQNNIKPINNSDKKEILSYDKNYNLNGKCYVWNSDGIIISVATYKHGLKHGIWKINYDNGKPAYKIYYKNGKKIKTWKHWDKNGKLISKRKY